MVREIAAVDDSTETEALKKVEAQLAKAPKRAAKGSAEAEGDGDDMQEEAA